MTKERLQFLKDRGTPSPFNSPGPFSIIVLMIFISLWFIKASDLWVLFIFVFGTWVGYNWANDVWDKRIEACVEYLDEEIRTRREFTADEEARLDKSCSAITTLLHPFIFVKEPSNWQKYWLGRTISLPQTKCVIRLIDRTLKMGRLWRTDKLWQQDEAD